jgi:YesN/AraC family two-component response regulator
MVWQYLDYGKLSDKDPKTAEKKIKELIDQCKTQGYYNLASMSYSNIGHLYLKQGQYELARATFKQGIEIGSKSKEQSGKALNMGFMGWLLQDLNSETLGSEYITNGITLLESNKENDEFKYLVLGKLYTLLGFSKTNRPDSLKIRLYNINKALNNYHKASPQYFNKNALISENYINIASIHYDLNNYKEAINNLKKAESYNKLQINHTSGRIYLGLAGNYSKLQQYDSTIVYGNKALKYINNENEVSLELYGYMKNAYENKGNKEMAIKYLNLSQNLENKINKSKLKTAGKINEENSFYNKKYFKLTQLTFIALGFLLLCLLGGIIYYKKKHTKEAIAFRNFRQIMKEKQEQEFQTKIDLTPNIRLEEAISNETEKQILKGLKKFENKAGFTQKGITQSKLAAQLHTNVRYLSIIIKKHKNENFSNYLNTLRINYIILKIEKDILYRKYKISYLADECGYPTPSAFTKAFNEITGVTPSSYISFLNQEERSINEI